MAHSAPETQRRNSIVGGLLVLLARGVLLWLVVPFAALAWVLICTRARKSGATFGHYLGWVDVNLISALQRSIFRPLVRFPTPWVPFAEMGSVDHRLLLADPI